jgi:hypothetical protein
MKRQIIIVLAVILLTASICSADNYVGGIPPTTVIEGTVSGGVYFDSYYGTGDQANYNPITIDQTFTLPDHDDIEWAMLFTTVYCGHMQNNYQGTADITFNGAVLGNEILDVPFTFKEFGGAGFEWVNDHVVRVTSDYMMWYNVTDLVQAGDNTASVHTDQIDSTFDGRIKLITLIAAYNDGSSKTIQYWVNQGHDVDSYYSDDYLEDYIGSTDFTAGLPSGATISEAYLTAVHMASTDGSYTFNTNSITSGTPQGSYCGSNIWDVSTSFVPEGVNTLTYDRTGDFYKIVLGILTAEYQVQGEEPDLLMSDIQVKHNYYNGAWVDLSNSVNVTVANNGAGGAGSFNVALYADSAEVETKSVSGLAAGATTVVSFDWIPDEVKTYTLNAVVDPDNVLAESNETNNELTESQDVGYNGYMGDKPLTTYAHETITGDIIYTYGDSHYSGKLFTDDAYTVNHSITLPEGATVKSARLYNYWTWSAIDTTGKYPLMSLDFDGSTLSPEVQYDDRKGWGSAYDYPAGTWAYNVTALVTGSGDHTTVVTNTDTDTDAFFCMDGLGLLVVYEDQNGQVVEYWINEGADMLSTQQPASGGLTPEEATATSLFTGSVDLSNVASARLWTVVQSGGDMNDKLIFNNMNWTGVYDSTPYPDLDIDEARAVEDYLTTSDNIAQISGAPIPGDYLVPSNAFLVITHSGMTTPALSISADLATVTVGVPTDVTFTVTNSSVPVEGAAITLSGSATGSGTTDANGTAVISVNATGAGTITATASNTGYTDGTTSLTANAAETPSLNISASPTAVLVGIPTDVTFTVTNNSELVDGATITLTGSATGSATTDINGTAVISVNATVSGIITATATKEGFTSATTTITAKVEQSGVSSSVSMTTNIISAVSLVVTPGSIEFGELSPGETSGAHTLTLENKGGNSLSVTVEVTDTADNLFVNGMLLDSVGWDEYTTSIAALALDTTDASLKVPEDYLRVGPQAGALVFWAEVE